MSRRSLTRNESSWLGGELDRVFGSLPSEALEQTRRQVRSKVELGILRHTVPQSEQAVRGMVRRYAGSVAYQLHIRRE